MRLRKSIVNTLGKKQSRCFMNSAQWVLLTKSVQMREPQN